MRNVDARLFYRLAASTRNGGGDMLPGAPGNPPIRPRRLWYWVAGGLLAGAAACVALGVAGFFALDKQVQEFQRITVPGQALVRFPQPGGYVLFVEKPGSCCAFNVNSGGGGGAGSGPPFASWSMNVALRPVAGGPPVPIHTWQGATESYAVAGHQGQTAMYVTINRPGPYYLAAENVTPGSITDLAAGRGIGRGVLNAVLVILAGIFVLVPAGLLIGVITAVRRHRSRRARLAAAWPPPAAPWPPPPAPPALLSAERQPARRASEGPGVTRAASRWWMPAVSADHAAESPVRRRHFGPAGQ